jgi:TetR/AcrR family transcriptional regulator, cholesterol catabolism regulator
MPEQSPMQQIETTRKRTPAFESRRLALLAAAARVFCAVGYDKASMRRIAGEAGVSLAGIYHYVASKEELLYSIQLHTFDSLLRDLRGSLEGIVDPRERLGAAVRNHVGHFGENMHELKICARELETLEGTAYDEVHRLRRSYFEAIHDIVRELRPPAGSPLGSWLATANLFGMLNWFYQWYDAERTTVRLDDLAAQQTALFLDGYVASASSADHGKSQ